MQTLMMLGALLLSQAQTTAANNGVITGQLLKPNGTPAAEVRVSAVVAGGGAGQAESLVSFARTDSAGRYRLEDVPPGRYLLIAGPIDTPAYYPGVASRERATIVDVVGGKTVSSIDFKTGFVARGRIVNGEGGAVSVEAGGLELIGASGARIKPSQGPDGDFEFRYLFAGTYQMRIDGARGQDVTLLDRDVEGLRIVVPRFHVSGRITGLPTGLQPDSIGLTIMLRSAGANPGLPSQIRAKTDGGFEFVDVSPGEYDILVGFPNPVSAQRITVNRNLEGLEAALPPMRVARIHIEGGGSLPPGRRSANQGTSGSFVLGIPQLVARAGRVEAARPLSSNANPVNAVSSDGLFYFVLSPDGRPASALTAGLYWIAMNSLPAGWYVKSMTSGNIDLTVSSLELTIDPTAPWIEVTLTQVRPPGAPEGVPVRGRVTGLTSGTPTGIVTIERKTPQDARTGYATEALVQPDGTFVFEGIPPGAYSLALTAVEGMRPAITTGIDVGKTPLTNVELSTPAAVSLFQLPCRTVVAECFDISRRLELEGVVKRFDFRNPRIEAVLTVTDEKGSRDIELAGPSPNATAQSNLKQTKVGDRLKVIAVPRRDGGEGALIVGVVEKDGKEIYFFPALAPKQP